MQKNSMMRRRQRNNDALKIRIAEIKKESELIKRKYAGDEESLSIAEQDMQKRYSKRNEIEKAEKMRKKTVRRERKTIQKQ